MNNISEITRQDILDIIKDGFIVHLDEPAYDSNVGDYIMEYPVKIPFYGRIDEISFLSRIYDLEKCLLKIVDTEMHSEILVAIFGLVTMTMIVGFSLMIASIYDMVMAMNLY